MADSGIIPFLAHARKLIEDGWTQKRLACDVNGRTVYYFGPKAASFCTVGALYRTGDDLGSRYLLTAFDEIMAEIRRRQPPGWTVDVGAWNDRPERTKEDVLSVFDSVIAKVWISHE